MIISLKVIILQKRKLYKFVFRLYQNHFHILVAAVRKNPCSRKPFWQSASLWNKPGLLIFFQVGIQRRLSSPLVLILHSVDASASGGCRRICVQEHGVLSGFRRVLWPLAAGRFPPCSGSSCGPMGRRRRGSDWVPDSGSLARGKRKPSYDQSGKVVDDQTWNMMWS